MGQSGGIKRRHREQSHHGKKEQSFKLAECGDPVMSSQSECVLNPTELFFWTEKGTGIFCGIICKYINIIS